MMMMCRCERCESDDDWGSHLDTVRCQSSDLCQGWMNPNSESIWRCQSCEQESPWKTIFKAENKIKHDLNMINNSKEHFGTITEYLNLINKSEDTLHPHHWLLTQIRFHILNNESFDKSDPEVSRVKVEQSRFLLEMFSKLRLSSSSMNGYVLYNFCVNQILVLNKDFQLQTINKDDFKNGLLQLQEHIDNCILCLNNEDDASYRKLLRDRIKALKINITDCLSFIDFI